IEPAGCTAAHTAASHQRIFHESSQSRFLRLSWCFTLLVSEDSRGLDGNDNESLPRLDANQEKMAPLSGVKREELAQVHDQIPRSGSTSSSSQVSGVWQRGQGETPN